MSMKLTNMAIPVTEVLYDDCDERPIDTEFLLPDYCPDIAAVLKCTMTPVIQSRQISGDRILVDGTANIRVLYMDEARKCIRSCEFSQDYSSNIPVKNLPATACVRTSAKTNYVNCRATSPRKLDIHGAISVKACVEAEAAQQVVSCMEADDVCCKKKLMHYSVPGASSEKSFTVTEMLDLGAGKPDAEVLIRGEAVPAVTDIKTVQGKVIVKGELHLKNLYVSDSTTGALECVYHEIPFSQILDLDGLQDEWLVEADLKIVSSDVHIVQNSQDENRLLSVNAKMNCQVYGTKSGAVEVLVDAYSTKYPMTLESKPLDTEQMMGIYRENSTVRQSLELPSDGIHAIVDMWCDVTPVSVRAEDNHMVVDCRMNVCMLATDEDGTLAYYERPVDFTMQYEDSCSRMPMTMNVQNVEYSLTGDNKMEIRVELDVVRRCYRKDQCVALTGAAEDDDGKFPEEKAALKIYYANSGESIWEIAKCCHTSMDAIMKENGLSSDVLSDNSMLLVPMC